MPRSNPPDAALNRVGAGLGIATAAWMLTAGGFHRGSVALATLVVAHVAVLLLARRLAARWAFVALLVLASAPVVLAAAPGRSLLDGGVVGYGNASGALYLIAATAASMMAWRAPSASRRRLGGAVAACWVVAVLLVRADTALVFAGLLALMLFLRRTAASRVVLAVGLVGVVVTLTGASLLGVTYEPGPRTAVIDRVVDTTLSQSRVVLWHATISTVATAPMTGVGVGQFRAASPAVSDLATRAHNELLQVAAETGVVGGVLVALLLAWTFARLWCSPLPPSTLPAAIALTGVATQANIDFVLHFPPVVLALAALVGTASGLAPAPSETDPPGLTLSEPTVTAGAGVVVAAVLMLVPNPLNNPQTVRNGAQWTQNPSGVRFAANGVVRSAEEPHDLYRALTKEPGLSVEIWAATTDLDQHGPARLVSSSTDIRNRNLTVGQSGDALVVRLRTTETDWNAVDAQVEVPGVFAPARRRHLVVTHDGHQLRVYVDGQLRRRAPDPSGSYASWNFTYPLLLGNENGGNRPWRGRLEAVAFYDGALSPAQVAEAFNARPDEPDEPAPRDFSAVTRYTFTKPQAGRVRDVSPAQLGSPMTRPARLPSDSAGFVPSFLDPRQASSPDREGRGTPPVPPTDRLVGHLALFAVLAVLLTRAVSRRWPVRTILTGIGPATVLLTILLSAYRYAQGGSPSLLDVAAATLGALVGASVWAMVIRRW